MRRRVVLKAGLVLMSTATAAAIMRPVGAAARVLRGGAGKWIARETPPPVPVDPSKRIFFTPQEENLVKAIFDQLIPADDLSVSASDAGCVVFIDHQLAGSYGKASSRFKGGPFQEGTPEQGDQSKLTPADIYKIGLAEMNDHCRKMSGKAFEELPAPQQVEYLEAMEAGKFTYKTIKSSELFTQFLTNVQEGFLSDPVYGGNRNMVGWRMIGFPGARYDYRDVAELKGQRLEIEPVSISDRI
ncbi:gluconate 2-dehydrogenase subunit 3 family protein [Gluconobacter kanchanaburiensis]|uniref:Gluconate 2-dehydrogenase n=1 Tax=Gluconobacter kanchanaburiensis NBRC 103587 TaxID=1307948 RepID=A0A511B9S7_9PROT|nr:gluconate 2-dehydrogenase subunit 3 family protein [Gluconobacter kanchanaburiensis]MBF0862775.1 gluconate 2-dehydrogenase subunit 3 family protein [Gluconobacter kanchanaburiensis]GBR68496.1 gluconate 2-dehydrogenase [Gluconobacter kanchanaburiensis NBRC 103587]GEK97054.1 hypothetical protein GKA01_22510 [Gluconobacter kanchanaburiensis NBRC 103587]